MELIRPFGGLNRNDAGIAGGKGASLGEMTQAGIPVPPGYVVLSSSFERFLEETDLNVEIDSILHGVDTKAMHTIEHASETIQKLILEAEMPSDIKVLIQQSFQTLDAQFVAVRSSATAEDSASAAWAGQLDSFLNTTEVTLLKNVQRCWASLFTPRAIFYRFEQGLHESKISVAVVVQKMVESDISGIAFSVHPVTEDRNQLIIEAGFGLGEAIVSGSVTPDSYVVEKYPRRIMDINVSTQMRAIYREGDAGGNVWRDVPEPQASSQVLTESQILELSEIIVGIESHYGFPCDIEWAYEGGKFYIVQSRPITTLSDAIADTKQTFVKAYTRNFSIIMQQAWYAANKENLIQKLSLTEYPYNPPYVYFMKDGVEEVWENTKANEWLLARLVERYKSDSSFFSEVYERYMQRLDEAAKWWKADIRTTGDLKMFVDLVFEGISDFVCIYAALMDESLPEDIKKQAIEFREKDAFFAKCNATLTKALHNIYPDLGHLVVYITREELGKEIDRNVLERRDSGFVLIPGILQDAMSFDDFVNKNSEYHFVIEKRGQDAEGLQGQTAYTGKVSGVVRIVKRTDQADKVTEGEIIVSPMTTPDFAPAMKKASGFITDVGGITCHAAIIAREMKKPCIIGTKFATQVLKDGDLVEVDANNGVVRVLKRKSEHAQDSKNLSVYNPADYRRMFAGKSLVFLASDIFLEYYRTLGVVSVQGEKDWMCFFPIDKEENFLQVGKELYTSAQNFKLYKDEFLEYIQGSATYFKRVLEKSGLEPQDVKEFLRLASKHFSLYSKTEFFYTNAVSEETLAVPVIEFDDLKMSGRAHLNKMMFEEDGYLRSLVRKIAKEKNIQEEELLSYSVKELCMLYEVGIHVPQEVILQRKKYVDGERATLFSNDALQIIEAFFSPYREKSTLIKGTIANKGYAKGYARVLIPDFKDFNKINKAVAEMKEGEILIAETTSPDIVQACHKALAIVTNQGGMLSHAAIISRELKIPCVIGTDKDVIINISTGDLVEVDADNGVVRIIEKAK